MNDPVILADQVRVLSADRDARLAREMRVRRSLLWTHAVKATLVGLTVLCTGIAPSFESVAGPSIRVFYGLLALIGGVSLTASLLTRKARWQAVSVGVVGAWDLLFAAGFIGVVVAHPERLHVHAPWALNPIHTGDAVVYIIPFLLCLSVGHYLHVRGIIRTEGGTR